MPLEDVEESSVRDDSPVQEESSVQEDSPGNGETPAGVPESPPAAQPLGQVERPPADQFQGKKRLLLVPLMFAPPVAREGETSEGQVIYQRYWDQVRTQVDALAAGLGGLHHVYHESLVEGGDEGLNQLMMADPHAHAMVQVRCQAGATLEATESIDLVTEAIDLQRCLMIPFTSDSVAARIQAWHAESTHNRYQYIAQQVQDTLQADETGLLLINERHQVQFPTDIEVFYIAPPALDEYRRWVQNWAERQQRAAEEMMAQGEGDVDDGGEESG